jgi:glutamyl-tRNA reductase
VRLHGEPAVERLFRVAAGLESAVVGEDEVLHQVREAMAEARRDGGLDPRLFRLFEAAIATGRRARAGRPAPKTGLASKAVAWLVERTELNGRPVLVAGAGVMGRAVVRALTAAGANVITASRDERKANLDLERAAGLAPNVAAIAVALAGPWRALATVEAPLPPIADLSSPPAVPARVRLALGSRFLDIDRLFERMPVEAAWLERAEGLVVEGRSEYLAWLRSRETVEVLRALQERSEERRRARVERVLRGMPELGETQRRVVEQLSRQLVKDLLHEPLTMLRADADGSGEAAARRVFGL